MSTITARYIGTMLSDYLQDGYTRPGQFLCLASLGGHLFDTAEQLAANAFESEDIPESIPDGDIFRALQAAIKGVDLRYIDEDGDRCDEPPEDRDDEEPYLYVVLEWETEPGA